MNNVFAHPRDFAATVLQLRPHPEADEHRPLVPLDLPLVRTLQADGPSTPRSAMHRPFAVIDPELLMRRREQAARLERLRQVAVDIDAANVAEQLNRSRKSVHTAIAAARESGEQQGTVAGWRAGFRSAIFAGVLGGVILGVAIMRLALTGSFA